MRYNHLSGTTIRHFAALDFFCYHTLIRVCYPLSHCLHLVVHILYLYPFQECHASVTLLLSEACLFVIKMEDTFNFHVGNAGKSTFWL